MIEGNKPRLQGHEKFGVREGWINKGLMIIKDNPRAFSGKEGPDKFGIGNNMVKSLRYWLRAFGLMTESSADGAILTDEGELIAEYDIYLEDYFSLWIMHSNIAKNKKEATTWFMYFNRCDAEELSKQQIEEILFRETNKYASGVSFSRNSLKNDIDVLLNMYSKNKSKVDPEDKNISPFTELALIKKADGKYSKIHPSNRIISEWNILYELSMAMDGKDSISIEKFVSDECGINAIYQVTDVVANTLLDKLEVMGYIHVDRTAGLDVIYKTRDFTKKDVIKGYYESHR
ncbi:MAG: DUF4007 family protein [Eubacterium sp.]